MKIKVCGMKHPDNIEDLAALPIDFVGFIFYQKSPRYVEGLDIKALKKVSEEINRVGVFVNETQEEVLCLIDKHKLTHVQLHGQESPEYCESLQCLSKDILIIKAFNVSESSDFENTEKYKSVCDYYLFDTKTSKYGGSGVKFDWNILDAYAGKVPFFLSGGITSDDVAEIKELSHPLLYALDLNSKFEIEPGLKDINKLKNFISHFK